MFNSAGSARRFSNWKILGGVSPGDYDSHKTMFAGPDPADPSRVLIRKLVQTGDATWCFEESRIAAAKTEGGVPTVHTTLHRLGDLDVKETVDDKEAKLRFAYRPVPNVIGFSLFTRAYENSRSGSFTLVENSLSKPSQRWADWFADLQDRRDISSYLKLRWALH